MTTPSLIPIGSTGLNLDSVDVTTSAGSGLKRETVVVADPANGAALAAVLNTTPAAAEYGAVVRTAGVTQTADTADIEYTPVATSVTASGDTVVYTPAAGKSVRLHWIYAINDPVANSSTKITIKMGTTVYYVAWAISKRQRFTGPVNGALTINLSAAGNVAVTAFVEDI